MKRRHAITTAIVVLVLAVLIYFQVRHWRNFDWHQFLVQTRGVNPVGILIGIALTYFAYVLRAARWMIFLRPTKDVPFRRLIAPQFIGFTGLALLGRPGEFVRPYLIARQEKLTFSSQLAAWVVERVFDLCSVALLFGVSLAVAVHYGRYAGFPQVKNAGYAMVGLSICLASLMFSVWWQTEFIANLVEKLLRPISHKFADAVCTKLRAFGEGLHTLQDVKAFFMVLVISLVLWLSIAQAYISVLHSYPTRTVAVQHYDESGGAVAPFVGSTVRLHEMSLPDVLLVMGASMVGSVAQLPGVGGGSQLAVVSLLSSRIFASEPYNIGPELALSCGMMLWLVTFMSVIPAGLVLAHFNRISLRAVSEESEEVAEEEIAHPHLHEQG